MNHKHRIQRIKDYLWRAFLLIMFLIGVVILIYHPEPAQAAYTPTVNATDAPLHLVYIPTSSEVDMIAQTLWGEARGLGDTEKAAVAWVIINRVEDKTPGAVKQVIMAPNQFRGYSPAHPITRSLRALAVDVVNRWIAEQFGEQDVGRVLPEDYLWFSGKNGHNVFRNQYIGGTRWCWTLLSPYED